MTSRSRLTCIVPTAGRSPYLSDCVQILATSQDAPVLVVAEVGTYIPALAGERPIRILTVQPGAGFARACNRALAEVESEFVALVNDDALVAADWSPELISTLQDDPEIAGAQGTIVRLDDANRVDGCGIGWNRYWQAIQLDRGAPPDLGAPNREVFGVSGTAAVFRRSALDQAALEGGRYFYPLLGTYYEDVELACRLRSHGFRTVHVPRVVARHGGGTSSAGNERWRWSHIYGNRLLVLARLWGRTFPLRLPALLMRDSVDLVYAAIRADLDRLAGIVSGWGRAVRRLSRFGHLGPPILARADLERFRIPHRGGLERT